MARAAPALMCFLLACRLVPAAHRADELWDVATSRGPWRLGSIEFSPPPEAVRLAELACRDAVVHDGLVDRIRGAGSRAEWLFWVIAKVRTCGLSEAYSHRLLDRYLAEIDAERRRILLRAIHAHVGHDHAGGHAYAGSVPARLESDPSHEALCLWLAYMPWHEKIRSEAWRRLRDPEVHASVTGSIIHTAWHAAPNADVEVRGEIHRQLCAFLVEACGGHREAHARQLAHYYVGHPSGCLTSTETALYESALASVVARASDLGYRFGALAGLFDLKSAHAVPLLEALMARDPGLDYTVGMVANVWPLESIERILQVVPHTRVRAACVRRCGSFARTLGHPAAQEASGRLLRWLQTDRDESVRRAALEELVAEISNLAANQMIDSGTLVSRGVLLLDIVLADPSLVVRRAAVDMLRPYEDFVDLIGADGRAKIAQLIASVRQ